MEAKINPYGYVLPKYDHPRSPPMQKCSFKVDARLSAIGGTNSILGANALNNDGDSFPKSRGCNGVVSEIELSLSAAFFRGWIIPPTTMVVLYIKRMDGSLHEIGRTEVATNSSHPKWIRKFTVANQFGIEQNLVFRAYDVDTEVHGMDLESLKLEEQRFLCEASCTMSEIMVKSNGTLTLGLTRKSKFPKSISEIFGKLTVYAKSVAPMTATELILRSSDLEAKDLFSKIDPFLVISKITECGASVPIYSSEVVQNDHSPKWGNIVLSMEQVGSKDRPLSIECFNFNSNGEHDLLGKVQKSLAELEKLHSDGKGEHLFVPTFVGHNHQNKFLKSLLFVDNYSELVQHKFPDKGKTLASSTGYGYNSSCGETSTKHHDPHVLEVRIDILDGNDKIDPAKGNHDCTDLIHHLQWNEHKNQLKNSKLDDDALKMMNGIFTAVAGQVVGGVIVHRLTSSGSSSWAGHTAEIANLLGLSLNLAGISLRRRSRALSTLLIKVGAVTTALAIIISMGMHLPPTMAFTVGLVAFLIMSAAAAFA